jgi:hypothetical protein
MSFLCDLDFAFVIESHILTSKPITESIQLHNFISKIPFDF